MLHWSRQTNIILKHTTDIDEGPKWVKMQSITQENDLEAFLSTAALAETDFTAGKIIKKGWTI